MSDPKVEEKVIKSMVVVGRKWHHPDIAITVTNKELAIAMRMDEFLKALSDLVGNPTFYVTKSQLLKKMNLATAEIIHGMKQETNRSGI